MHFSSTTAYEIKRDLQEKQAFLKLFLHHVQFDEYKEHMYETHTGRNVGKGANKWPRQWVVLSVRIQLEQITSHSEQDEYVKYEAAS